MHFWWISTWKRLLFRGVMSRLMAWGHFRHDSLAVVVWIFQPKNRKNGGEFYSLKSCCWCFLSSAAFSNRPLRALLGPIKLQSAQQFNGPLRELSSLLLIFVICFSTTFSPLNFFVYSNIDSNWFRKQWHFHIYMWWAYVKWGAGFVFWIQWGKCGKAMKWFFEHRFRKLRLILTVKEL